MLIDIEGIDGTGKGTQARLLCDRLVATGVSATVVSFPRYGATLFGKAVGEFLNGEFGSLAGVHPFLVSLLFAGDRFESKEHLLETLRTHDAVVLDRYVPSNVAHQAAKLDGDARTELTRRILKIEYTIFGLPRPDIVLLLDLPVPLAQELIARKAARQYTDRKTDLQEADAAYLARVRDVYQALAQSESNWQTVPVSDGSQLRTIEDVAAAIWQIVDKLRQRAPKD